MQYGWILLLALLSVLQLQILGTSEISQTQTAENRLLGERPLFNASPTLNIPKNCKCLSQFTDCSPPVFLHAPKTGGESIEGMFGLMMNNHMTAVERREEFHPHGRDFVIGVVRNPYDRAFSWFRYCINGHHSRAEVPQPETVCYLARQTFAAVAGSGPVSVEQVQDALLRWLQSDVLLAIVRQPATNNGEYWFSRSMRDYMANADGSLAVDYMLLFESLGDELRTLMRDCLGHIVEVKHANKSGGEGENNSGGEGKARVGATVELALEKGGKSARISVSGLALLSSLKWFQVFSPQTYHMVEQIWAADFAYFGYMHATESLKQKKHL